MGTRSRSAGSAAGSEPPANSGTIPRWRYPIEPTMSASRALAVILETLLAVVVAKREGVIVRRDEEYLHDYRVAVRRTRSALSLFGTALPPAALERGRKFFQDLGRGTNDARDLDVLLLELPVYARLIPTSHRKGLEELERHILRENTRHYDAVRKLLESESYSRAIEARRSDLAALGATDRGGPMTHCFAAAIRTAASQVDRRIEQLGGEHLDEPVHRLRIRLKKLRYALEFTRALTPGGEVESFIDSLKRMQDQLGGHRDLAVHRQRIGELIDDMKGSTALVAVGNRLRSSLHDRQVAVSRSIQSGMAEFQREAKRELGRVLNALGERVAD